MSTVSVTVTVSSVVCVVFVASFTSCPELRLCLGLFQCLLWASVAVSACDTQSQRLSNDSVECLSECDSVTESVSQSVSVTAENLHS